MSMVFTDQKKKMSMVFVQDSALKYTRMNELVLSGSVSKENAPACNNNPFLILILDFLLHRKQWIRGGKRN